MSARSDEDLMAAYTAGDLAAFEALFARHRGTLFTFLCHQVGDRALAEDLVKDVFLRVVRGRTSYQPGGAFRSWLYTIARNAVTDQHRRRGVRKVVVLEEDMRQATSPSDADFGGATSNTEDPARVAGAGDLRVAIESALLRLPDEQREVFLLRERAQLEYQNIAELTGVGLATVKSRMRYALAALRQHLAHIEEVAFE